MKTKGLFGKRCVASTQIRRRRAFTLLELLVVIALIGLLASMVVGVSGMASRRMREARVKAELNQLVTAIEDYRGDKGSYPPDNAKGGVDWDPRLTPLYYELTGAVFTNNTFIGVNQSETISPATLLQRFGVGGIVNSARDKRDVKTYVSFKPGQYKEMKPIASEDVELLVVPVAGPHGNPKLLAKDGLPMNPWKYDASTTNRHNRQSYDLWAEIIVGKDTKIIGNWSP